MPLFKVRYSYWIVSAPNEQKALERAIRDIREDTENIISVEKYKKKQAPLWRLLLLGK
jgi:hypothetical protein